VPPPPVAMAQSVTTAANTPKAITLTATPGTSGDTLTYAIVTNPAHGTLTGTAPNVAYTPAPGYVGPDSFTFDATETGVVSNPATVSITVSAGPPPPVANNQSASTNKNTAVAITLTGTPGTSGDTLTFAIATNPAHGALTGTPPNMTYTPTAGYVGPDSFTFNVTESNGATSTTPGTVSISVVQAPPVASKTTLSAASNTPAPGASDAISITVASASTSSTTTPTGTLTISVDGTTQSPSLTLTNGSAAYTFSSTAAGPHTIAAAYSGDTTYAASSGSLTVTVTAPTPVASKTTLSAASSTPASGASDAIAITVASGSASSTATPTGTVTILVDGVTQSPPLTLANGSATYTFSSAAAGTHTITGNYSGDSTYATSSGTLTLTVTGGSFKLTASNVTVPAGSPGSSTVTITPQNGYKGTVAWTVSSSPVLTNGCFSLPRVTVSGNAPVAVTLTVYTIASACSTSAAARAADRTHGILGSIASNNDGPSLSCFPVCQAAVALVGLLFVGLLSRRSLRLGTLAAFCLLAAVGLGASACAGAASSTSAGNAAKGSYSVTIVGTDTASASITASTSITLTID